MPIAFYRTTAPWGLRLPRGGRHWPRELELPKSGGSADVRAWLDERVTAGDRGALLYLESSMVQPGVTGGTLSYRRSAPDVRSGHRLYGIAKFEVTCEGVTVLSSGRSWWNAIKLIRRCDPGMEFRGARICGVLPS